MKKNLISVLKKFFMKLSGQEPEGNNLVDIIDSGSNALGEVSEESIFNVPIIYDQNTNNFILNKTAGEIYDAFNSGLVICMLEDERKFILLSAEYDDRDGYSFTIPPTRNFSVLLYTAQTSNDYPIGILDT